MIKNKRVIVLMVMFAFILSACENKRKTEDNTQILKITPMIEDNNLEEDTNCEENTSSEDVMSAQFTKPVIYLYPQEELKVSVELDFDGELTFTYPEYKKNWQVKAEPDGSLTTLDGKEYSYLFWEGNSEYQWELEEGFVVEGSKTVEFLQCKLKEIGLTEKEYNEFIVYWAPMMQENNYNLIYFAGKEYEDLAKLSIDPQPDNILRVFMVYKPLEKEIEVKEQELKRFERSGFTVVEWGGTQIGR